MRQLRGALRPHPNPNHWMAGLDRLELVIQSYIMRLYASEENTWGSGSPRCAASLWSAYLRRGRAGVRARQEGRVQASARGGARSAQVSVDTFTPLSPLGDCDVGVHCPPQQLGCPRIIDVDAGKLQCLVCARAA